MNRLSYCFAAAACVTVAAVLLLIIYQSRLGSSGTNETRLGHQQTVSERADVPATHEGGRVALKSKAQSEEPDPPSQTTLEVPPLTMEQLVRRLGGEHVAAVMQNPDSASAVLLETFRQPPEPHQCIPRSPDTDVPTDVAERISAAVLDPQRNLQSPGAKGCLPIYGVRIRYTTGKEQIDLYLCFQCAVLAIYRNGLPVAGAHFDSIQQVLKNEVIAIFPTDRVLLGLEKPREDLPPTPHPPSFGP